MWNTCQNAMFCKTKYTDNVINSCGIKISVCSLFQEIVSEFEEHGIPLDVLVLDMDWHITFYDGTKDSVRDGNNVECTLFQNPMGMGIIVFFMCFMYTCERKIGVVHTVCACVRVREK